jgi:hypothetical protein
VVFLAGRRDGVSRLPALLVCHPPLAEIAARHR